MGPTGSATELPENGTVVLCGGGLGNAVLFSIGKKARRLGNRVIYFAGYKKAEDFYKREELEAASDVLVLSVDRGEPIPAERPQDRPFVGNIVEAMTAWAEGRLGETPIRLSDVDRLIAIGSDRMMAAVARARHGVLAPHLKPTLGTFDSFKAHQRPNSRSNLSHLRPPRPSNPLPTPLPRH